MRKKILVTALITACFTSTSISVPIRAQQQAATGSALTSTATTQQPADATATVSVRDFIQDAVQALTYQHGVEPMKVAVAEGWVQEGEFTATDVPIKQGECARILVRALGQAKNRRDLSEYIKQAQSLGLMNGAADEKVHAQQSVTRSEITSMFEHYKQIKRSKIDNKGVPRISVHDFTHQADKSSYNLSSDGTFIAYLAPWRNRQNIYVQNMNKSSKSVRITSSTDDIPSFFWVGNTIFYMKDKDGDGNVHLYSAAFNGFKEKDLTPYSNVKASIIGLLPGDKNHFLIQMNKENAQVFDVYKLNVKSGKTTLIMKNPGNIQEYLPNHAGKILLAKTFDGTVLSRNTEKEKFRTFLTVGNEEGFFPLGFSRDNQNIYALSDKGRDKMALVTFDRQGKEKLVYAHPEVDINDYPIFDDQGNLLSVSFITDKVHHKFFDARWKALYQKLQHKLNVSESELRIVKFNENRNKFIIEVTNDKTQGKYYYYNAATDQFTFLNDSNSRLKPESMADMQPVSYKSRDGLTIHGYVTLPKNKTPEQLPLIVNPHGGPWLRDKWGFDPKVQLLANRGYAVLQVNFRASVGYGKAFRNAGNKQWGGKIQDDITDGVQWAIKQGIADPKRIAIYGRSFGGYAALAGITYTPQLYAAAIAFAGISNLFTDFESMPPTWEKLRNELYRKIGHPEKDKALLTKVSPIFHIDNILTPLFVAHGANDPIVKKEQAEQIVNALRAKGKDVQYMLKENEGHHFLKRENEIEFYNAMLKFLDKHLNGGGGGR